MDTKLCFYHKNNVFTNNGKCKNTLTFLSYQSQQRCGQKRMMVRTVLQIMILCQYPISLNARTFAWRKKHAQEYPILVPVVADVEMTN